MRKTHAFGPAAIALALVGLAACQGPTSSSDMPNWTFSGVNDANLAAMIEDPMDLAHGRSERQVNAQAAVLPVFRLRKDQPKQLPSSDTTSSVGGGASNSGGGGGGTPPELQ